MDRSWRFYNLGVGVVAAVAVVVLWNLTAAKAPSEYPSPEVADPANPLGVIAGTESDPSRSGRLLLSDADDKAGLSESEADLLRACGAANGAYDTFYTADWGGGGTVFACRDAVSARTALQGALTLEKYNQFTPRRSANAGVHVLHRTGMKDPGGFTTQYRVRYASGGNILAVVILAKSDKIGHAAAKAVVESASRAFPPTG